MTQNVEKILNPIFDLLDTEIKDGYVVMNKYDEVPYLLPSDLDMVVSQSDFVNLDKIITKVSKLSGLLITQKIWHNYRKCAYILSPLNIEEPFRLQLDFFSDFAVKNTPLLIPYQETKSRTRTYGRFTIPDYDLEYVFLLMRRIFKNDFNEKHCKIIYNVLCAGNKELIKEYSEQYFGKVNASIIYDAIMVQDINKLKLLRDQLWVDLKKFSSKQSFGFYKIKYKLNELKRAIYRIKYPVGMSIALLSPDGGGKSSVYLKLEHLCWGSFHGTQKRYFRPRLFKNIGSYNVMNPKGESEANPEPHNVILDNPVKSFIRFMFYNLDFLFGYFLLVKPAIIKKSLVVFDRYYYDYFIDMYRYKYKLPSWVPGFFEWMIPKPSIVFILNGTAEVFYSRKQELQIEELERQLVSYHKLSLRLKNSCLIDANQELDKVAQDITSFILGKKAEQTAKAMGNKLNDSYLPI